MDISDSEFWSVGPPSLLSATMAPLAGVLLSLLALWTAAMPAPTHVVALYAAAPCRGPAAPSAAVRTVVVDADNRLFWDGRALADVVTLDA